jgi:hypothetical protein
VCLVWNISKAGQCKTFLGVENEPITGMEGIGTMTKRAKLAWLTVLPVSGREMVKATRRCEQQRSLVAAFM